MGRIDTYPQNAILQPNSPVTLAYGQMTATQGITSAQTDITNCTVSVTVPDGRRIRISAYGEVQNTQAAVNYVTFRIFEGSTQLTEDVVGLGVTGANQQYGTLHPSVVLTPTAGIHTYKLSAAAQNTASNVLGATISPVYILVEDITGMPLPVATASVPVGSLAYAQVTANQTGITTEVDLTGLSVNVAVPAGRTLKITGKGIAVKDATGGLLIGWINKDGVKVAKFGDTNMVANGEQAWCGSYIDSPSAGTHTYKLSMRSFATTGSLFADNSTDHGPAYIMVEDVTGTPAAGNGAPSSTLGYAEVTTSQGTFTAATDITGLSVTVTVPAGRRLRISSEGYVQSSVANDGIDWRINEGATILQNGNLTVGVANLVENESISVVVSPSAGTHTYKIVGSRSAGTGNITMTASAQNPAFILVEDITGATYTYSQPGVLPVSSTALPANPQIGAMVYEIDTGATKIWNGTSWQIFAQGSSTTLGYAQATTSQAAITTATDIAGLNVTVTVPSGRRLRISASIFLASTVATDGVRILIMEGATQLQLRDQVVGTAGPQTGLDATVVVSPTAGTHTYKVQGARWIGSGTASNVADPTYPSWILVEDITGTNSAAPAVNVPVGVIAQAIGVAVADQTFSTSFTQVTNLSVNVSVPAGRVLKITSHPANAWYNSNATGDVLIQILQDGSRIVEEEALLATGAVILGPTISTIVSPSAGTHTYSVVARHTTSATMKNGTNSAPILWVEDVTPTPAPANTSPSSTLGYAEAIVGQGGIVGSNADLTSLTLTVTVAAGRRIKISGHTLARSTVANDVFQVGIYEGATLINAAKDSVPTTDDLSVDVFAIITPSAGTHTYKLVGLRSSGSGTITVAAGATFPAFILIEDITAASTVPVFVSGGRHAVRGRRDNSNQALTVNANTTIIWNAVDYDETAAMNTTTGVYTAPESGLYRMEVRVRLAASNPPFFTLMTFLVNGVEVARGQEMTMPGNSLSLMGGMEYKVIAGQTIVAQIFIAAGTVSPVVDFVNNTGVFNWCNIRRIGPI